MPKFILNPHRYKLKWLLYKMINCTNINEDNVNLIDNRDVRKLNNDEKYIKIYCIFSSML